MADDLDKFVLQYTVDMKDAIARLEKLNSKVEGVTKATVKTKTGFKEFSSGAADELGKVVPGVDKVTAAVKMLGAEFAVAGLAVGALGLGIKAVMNLREQYNAQRKAGMETGVSAVRMEEYQRKFVKNSNGNVSREAAMEGVKNIQQLISKAYTDPTRMGTENRQLRLLGINPGERGKGSTNVNDAMTQMATRFQGMTPAQVQGVAKSIGMSQDWALALQKIGPAIGRVTEQTEAELNSRQKAGESMAKFNDSMAKLTEQFTESENILATKLLPSFGHLVDLLQRAAKYMPDAAKAVANKTEGTGHATQNLFTDLVQNAGKPKSKWGFAVDLFDMFMKPSKLSEDKRAAATNDKAAGKVEPKGGAKAEPVAKTAADKLVDGLDESNKQGAQTADDLTLAVNMFAGAVASFSNAVDERQAWAAWAGEIGKSAGLGSPNEPTGTPEINAAAGPVGPTKYDDYFNNAAKKTGLDVNLIKSVAKVESRFNPKAESEQGAQGLMQVMPENFKSLGIKNGFDPEQSIMGGAKLLAQYIKDAGNDVRQGLMLYHAGPNRSGWGPKTRAYPGLVLGDGVSQPSVRGESQPSVRGESQPSVRGESREKMAIRSVQQNIANRLGVPLAQIQMGGVSRGDVSFADSQMQGGIKNNINNLQRELQQVGLPQQARSKIMTELRDQQRGLATMQQYGGSVEDRAPEGPRSITIGERAVIINVTGSGNPEAVAAHVKEQFSAHFADVVNSASDGLKY